MLEVGDDLDDLLDLVAADVTSAREQKQKAAAKRVNGLRAHITRLRAEEALNQLQSPLDGQQLMGMFGHPPGRWIATIKDHLRELVIDGELAVGDVERATEIARAMVDAGEVEFAGR
jgi:poly(A) polymerase